MIGTVLIVYLDAADDDDDEILCNKTKGINKQLAYKPHFGKVQ
jgi:hypothetical protein